MVETRGMRGTSWKLVSYEWGGGPPRWIKWRDEEGSVTDGVNGVKGTAHASFIRGGHRRDVVSNRVTRGWIEWREGGRNQEEVTKVTSCRPLASQTNIPLIKRIKWVLALLVFFFSSLSILVVELMNRIFYSFDFVSNDLDWNRSNYFIEYAYSSKKITSFWKGRQDTRDKR